MDNVKLFERFADVVRITFNLVQKYSKLSLIVVTEGKTSK